MVQTVLGLRPTFKRDIQLDEDLVDDEIMDSS